MENITINTEKKGPLTTLYAKAGDVGTRFFRITLMEGDSPYSVPQDAAAAVRYELSDGRSGVYDTVCLADGTQRPACVLSENTVTCEIAGQVLQEPGTGQISVTLYSPTGRIGTWNLALVVQADPACGEEITDPARAQLLTASISAFLQLSGDVSRNRERIDVLSRNGSDQGARMSILEARMDGFTALASGSTTGDAELADIRTECSGYVASGAGDAVRDQIGMLQRSLNALYQHGEADAVLFWTAQEVDSTGNITASANYRITQDLSPEELAGAVITAPASENIWLYRWNAAGEFSGYRTIQKGTVYTVPEDSSPYSKFVLEATPAALSQITVRLRANLVTKSDLADSLVPAYDSGHLQSRIQDIRAALRSETADAFLFLTDPHIPQNSLSSPKLIGEILKDTSIRKVICGGDIPGPFGTAEECLASGDTYWKHFSNLPASHFLVHGNHDFTIRESSDGSEGFTADSGTLYDYCMRRQEDRIHGPLGKYYGYFDNSRQKIRYILLDTCEIRRTGDNSTGYDFEYGMNQEQIQWLRDTLLSVEEGYHVLVIGHCPVESSMDWTYSGYTEEGSTYKNLQIVSDLLQAFANHRVFEGQKDANGNRYALNVGGVLREFLSCPADFTGAKGALAAYIHGHMHVDRLYSVGGVRYISVGPDACCQDDTAVTRQSGTVSESLLDAVVMDPAQRKLTLIRIGAGNSATVTY
ncbi:MAG: metallophosphoesterase [Firmicutes bacterium]|nr:metallophosphoesterase [Bacillota bacterium]